MATMAFASICASEKQVLMAYQIGHCELGHAALSGAQKFSGPANLEIALGNEEPV